MAGPHTDRLLCCLVILFGILLCTCGVCDANLPYSVPTETRSYWINKAKHDLRIARNLKPNIAVAKNVILFIGDGMGVSTVTASRILKGQLQGQNGEEELLSFEMFPHIGMSKTYNEDAQTPDSAGTATAFLCGVKTNMGILGIDARGRRGQCETANGTELTSMLDWSRDAGKSVGLVTTTRITHATPAAAYAHSAERNWESDKDMTNVTGGCVDIARQLVDDNIDINVILGGGRREFLRNNDTDPEYPMYPNTERRDGRNLVEDWQAKQAELNRTYRYVWNLSEFESVEADSTDYLLGLFNPSHMQYELDRPDDGGGEPSIEQMTEKAIEILSKNENGFFLLVEGGRIDHAHHQSNAKRSLYDTLAFERAVARAVAMTSETDTLIVVSSDHSHVFTIGGYPTRGNPILGLTDDREGRNKLSTDTKPFTTLLYTNGPGAYVINETALRPDPSLEVTNDTDYKQQSAVHLSSETHAGEDVAIYARGPMSHLFHGLHEQNYIAHVMAYAACVGDYSDPSMCASYDVEINGPTSDSKMNLATNISAAISMFLLLIFINFKNLYV